MKQVLRSAMILAPVGMVIGAITVAALHLSNGVYSLETTYECSILIEYNPPGRGGTFCTFTSEPIPPLPKAQYSTSTEFNVFQSHKLRNAIIDDLALTERWKVSRENALDQLSKSIDADDINNTYIKRITVHHHSADDTRDIAFAAARAYKSLHKELEADAIDRHLDELDKAIQEQEKKVEERSKVLAAIVKNKVLSGAAEDRDTANTQDYVDAKRELETDLDLLQTLKLKQIAEKISSKIPGEPVRILSEPSLPTHTNPDMKTDILKGGAIGLVIGLFLSFPLQGRIHAR